MDQNEAEGLISGRLTRPRRAPIEHHVELTAKWENYPQYCGKTSQLPPSAGTPTTVGRDTDHGRPERGDRSVMAYSSRSASCFRYWAVSLGSSAASTARSNASM
jgi:hypothetical protein